MVFELRANLERMDKVRAQIGEAKTIPKLKAEKLKSKYKEAANEKLARVVNYHLKSFRR